jgi:hypothetical protein
MSSLAEARVELPKLDWPRARTQGAWSAGQVLAHCAQSIEYSLSGFPRNKPWLFRAVIGKLVLAKFLRQGFMNHDLEAAIPGAPALAPTDAAAGLARLLQAIDDFEAHNRFAIHFVYGSVDKSRYDRIQALHIANHLAGISFE